MFTIPVVSKHIWFFADVPHALQNIRNHVRDDGLYLTPPAGTADTPVLGRALLTELVTVAADPELKDMLQTRRGAHHRK